MRQRAHGFTLIELLVVLVIISIIVTVGVISLGALGKDPPAKLAAGQLADLAGLAQEQAVMQGQEYGLLIDAHAYAFYIYDGRRWTPAKGDSLFRRHELGDQVTLTLNLDGAPVTLALPPATAADSAPAGGTATAPAADGSDESPKPQLLLLSSGELQPFEILVSGVDKDGGTYTVKGTLAYGIQVTEPDTAGKH
ncbi:MAG TPA: type II secretion system minor pseudopilin GspH [Gammaproteobacteria bacterium]|nr:type II secretion system minor pseudopilin GspH [Gammaproteobacteria bacterium]